LLNGLYTEIAGNISTHLQLKLKLKNMKSLLYMGGSLMLAASIYGVVDYSNSNRKDDVDNLYKKQAHLVKGTDAVGLAAFAAEELVVPPIADTYVEWQNPAANGKKSKKLSKKFFSRAEIEE
jgi:hypothetical protein